MIELEQVSKQFGDVIAVDNVSICIERSDTVALIGPSGSGKTTLLELIAGLEKPNSGTIRINGQTAGTHGKIVIPPHRRQVGMIFQDLALWPHMTVTDNIAFGLKNLKINKTQRNEKIQAIAEQVEINHVLDRYPHALSGGEKQRVAMARALIVEPQILLMDEPLSNLDTVLKKDLLNLILKLAGTHRTTLVYVTHQRDEALAVPGIKAVMDKGRLIQVGAADDLRQNPKNEFVKRFIRS